MPKIQYVAKGFTGASSERIRLCNQVWEYITEYLKGE
jgi:hypothetical protein